MESEIPSIELNPKSLFGIEIEICIEEKKYNDLKKESSYETEEGDDDDNTIYKSEHFDFKFKTTSPESPDEDSYNMYRTIKLTQDFSCSCPEDGYKYKRNKIEVKNPIINAEIISPVLDNSDYKVFCDFLQKKIFDEQTGDWKTGPVYHFPYLIEPQLPEDESLLKETKNYTQCGVHIHWSTTKYKHLESNYHFNFQFIRVIANIIYILDSKINDESFSGRNKDNIYVFDKKKKLTPYSPFLLQVPYPSNIIKMKLDNKITIIDYNPNYTKILNDLNLKKNSNISIYNMENFHMEMRMFSFDKIFEDNFEEEVEVGAELVEKDQRKPTSTEILTELNRFVKYTDTFMTNVLEKLVECFDQTENMIKSNKSKEFKEYFLFEKKKKAYTDAELTEAMKRLFGHPLVTEGGGIKKKIRKKSNKKKRINRRRSKSKRPKSKNRKSRLNFKYSRKKYLNTR